jgi:hypothetical protein
MIRTQRRWLVPAVTVAALLAVAAPVAQAARSPRYEVWMTDQNNTAGYSAAAPRGTHGGHLLIYQGVDLDSRRGPFNRPGVIDFAVQLAAGGPNNPTGAVAFVASGHVAILDGETRRPKALFRMTAGAGGARQAHAAIWTLDGRSVLVANQNGKLLERIDYDPRADTFSHVTAATLDLANCTTPNRQPCQSATPASEADPAYLGPNNRPDNAPICPVLTSDHRAYVTLRGGGLLVVDAKRTPMAIVGEYGTSTIGRDGCGGVQRRGHVYLNGGTGTPATNPTEFTLYRIRNAFPRAPGYRPPNTPAPLAFYRDTTPETPSDAHGLGITRSRYLWQFDRLANLVEVFDAGGRTPAHIGTLNLEAPGISSDPTPDLVALSPRGDRFYVSLRGPLPQTGAHASIGNTPGLGIVTIRRGGRTGALAHVLRTTLISPVTGAEESDPHGIAVRRRPGRRP